MNQPRKSAASIGGPENAWKAPEELNESLLLIPLVQFIVGWIIAEKVGYGRHARVLPPVPMPVML